MARPGLMAVKVLTGIGMDVDTAYVDANDVISIVPYVISIVPYSKGGYRCSQLYLRSGAALPCRAHPEKLAKQLGCTLMDAGEVDG